MQRRTADTSSLAQDIMHMCSCIAAPEAELGRWPSNTAERHGRGHRQPSAQHPADVVEWPSHMLEPVGSWADVVGVLFAIDMQSHA